jgi:hypothetical protein
MSVLDSMIFCCRVISEVLYGLLAPDAALEKRGQVNLSASHHSQY